MEQEQHSLRILLIEDDKFFSELIARKLRERKCVVMEKESFEEARDVLREEDFHAVCFDMVVLGAGGLKKVSELMTNDRLQSAAVVLLTDKETEAEITASGLHRSVTHLVKSEADPDEIASLIFSLAARRFM